MHASNEGLTPQDIERLQAPLPLADHEAREKGTSKDKKNKQYLVYINQEGVIPLLNSIDPNWTWEVQNVHFDSKYVSVTGRLTLKGIAREGVGGNSPNGASSPVDEDTVKGAETDALKRAALRFGVGLYLRGAPSFWIDAELSSWKGAEEALKQFGVWYQREFGKDAKNGQQGTQNSAPRQSTTQPRQNASASQIGGATGGSVEQLTNGLGANVTRIEDAPLPRTKDGVPVLGLLDMIEIRRTAWAEKLVTGKEHFANLIDLLYREGSIRDASTADAVLDAIRKHAAEKAKVS